VVPALRPSLLRDLLLCDVEYRDGHLPTDDYSYRDFGAGK